MNVATAEIEKEALAKGRENLKSRYWRLNHLYWIMDDHGNKIKFRMNAIQTLLYWAMWWLNVILKSRQHGITTFLCIFFLDACLFTPNVRAGIIAHKLADAKKIFRDKVLFAYQHLPQHLRVHRLLDKEESQEILFANNSGIYVATSMRSGTLQYLHISEYGYLCQHTPGKAREIRTGAMETVHEGGMLFVESTAEGRGDDFERMCRKAERMLKAGTTLTRLDYAFHFFAWFQKPENQIYEPVEISDKLAEYFQKIEAETGEAIGDTFRWWYAKKHETLGTDMFKEHPSTPDEAFYAAAEGTYYGDLVAAAYGDGRIGDYPHDPAYPVYTFSDFGDMYTATIFVQFIHGQIRVIDDYWDYEGAGAPAWANVLNAKGYTYMQHVAGPDIHPTEGSNKRAFATGQLLIDSLLKLGFKVTACEPHDFDSGIRAAREEIWPLIRVDKVNGATFITGASGYTRKKDLTLSDEDHTEFHDTPAKTWHRHIMDALRHLAVMYRIHRYTGETIEMLYDYESAGVGTSPWAKQKPLTGGLKSLQRRQNRRPNGYQR